MKNIFKKFTSIFCATAILISATSVAAFACLFCDDDITEEPTTENVVPNPQYGDPKNPEISDTDSF